MNIQRERIIISIDSFEIMQEKHMDQKRDKSKISNLFNNSTVQLQW